MRKLVVTGRKCGGGQMEMDPRKPSEREMMGGRGGCSGDGGEVTITVRGVIRSLKPVAPPWSPELFLSSLRRSNLKTPFIISAAAAFISTRRWKCFRPLYMCGMAPPRHPSKDPAVVS
ncbi:hypothetical protein EYF80_036533 [Liparis tanakae]|uniref:Uncharacterized protein n=1 Tax=Liparis tanakae TaxID=230148 RepID=A0A4Z2GKI8_9TELE|nr:hypothetical protein EYF80_036533 [Liparis tanakae]